MGSFRFDPNKAASPEETLALLLKLIERGETLEPQAPPSPSEEELPGFLKRLGGSFARGGIGLAAGARRGIAEVGAKVGVVSETGREAGLREARELEEYAGTLPQLEPGFGADVVSGAGSTVPYLAPMGAGALIGSPFGPPGMAAGATIGGLLSALGIGAPAHIDEQLQRRIAEELEAHAKAGASPERLAELESELRQRELTPGVMAGGAALGAFEAVPVGRGASLGGKAAKGILRGKTFQAIFRAGKREAVEEAVQEGASEIGHQALNPAESLDPAAAAYNAAVGGFVGGPMGSGMAAGGIAVNRFRQKRLDAAANQAAEESGLPPEAIKEELTNPLPGETASAEIQKEAETIPAAAAAEVDQVIENSGVADLLDEAQREGRLDDLTDSIRKLSDEMAGEGEGIAVLGDAAQPAPPEPTPVPAPEPAPAPAPVATEAERTDAFAEANADPASPDEREAIVDAIEGIKGAESTEEVEEAAGELQDIVGDDPVIPPEPETEAEITDLETQEEEAAASEGLGPIGFDDIPEEVEDGRERLPTDRGSERGDGRGPTEGDGGREPSPGKVPGGRRAGPVGGRRGRPTASAGSEGGTDVRPPGRVPERGGDEGTGGEEAAPQVGGRVTEKDGARARYVYDLPSKPESVRPRSTVANLQAGLDALAELSLHDRAPTQAELDALAGYGGFGNLPRVFDPGYQRPKEKVLAETLRKLAGDEAVAGARASTQNAHYTAVEIARGIWDALGVTGNLKGDFLEPGAGIGVFAGTIPKEIDPEVRLRMIERDPISSRIATILHPTDTVSPTNLSLLRDEDRYDGAVGNVPFGKGPIHVDGKSYSLHDGVILKTLKAVRPGGLAALITSRYTMDKLWTGARSRMAALADLVAAVRLPRGTFEKDAGTQVVTDVLVFRKRKAGEEAAKADWIETDKVSYGGSEVSTNKFFIANPDYVLGTPVTIRGMYTEGEYAVEAPAGTTLPGLANSMTESLRWQMEKAKAQFDPIEAGEPEPTVQMETIDEYLDASDEPLGTLAVSPTGEIVEVVGVEEVKQPDGSTLKKNTYAPVQITQNKQKIRELIELRRTAQRIAKMQGGGVSPDKWKAEQAKGVSLLEAFWKAYGPINKEARRTKTVTRQNEEGEDYQAEVVTSVTNPNIPRKFDRSSMSTMARVLENYDPQTGKATKSRWLTGEIGVTPKPEVQPETLSDAVIVSLASRQTKGRIDPAFIAEQLQLTPGAAEARMRHEAIAYYSPAEGWMLRSQFLSGDVRARLEQVKEAGLEEERRVLEENQPSWISAGQISPGMGQQWIRSEWRRRYLTEKTGLSFRIQRNEAGTGWTVAGGEQSGAITDWLTKMLELPDGRLYPPGDFVRAVLNESAVKVYVGSGDTRVFSPEQTTRVNGQVARMGQDFKSWLKREYRVEMEDLFNKSQNRYAFVQFEDPGDTYQIPGLAQSVKMWVSQRRAVFRQLVQGNMGLFHAVGGGKTLTTLAIAIENKRLGLARKPAIIVPLAIQKQFAKEAQDRFPLAKILVADELSEGAGSEKGRSEDIRRFVAQTASSDWDVVILNKEQFTKIRLSAEAQVRELERELSEILESIELSREEGQGRFAVRRMEATRDRVLEQLQEQRKRMEGKRDAGFTFEDTGIDLILVDESHNYKNLKVSSAIQEAQLSGSAVAQDLKQKINDLEERANPGRSIVLSTGTPVTNRVAELHTVFRYLADPRLKSLGDMHLFENWRRQFSEIESRVEQKSTGAWMPTARIRFNNLTPLQRFLHTLSDIVTEDELDVTRPEKVYVDHLAEVDPALWERFMDWIRYRHALIQRGTPMEIGPADRKGEPKFDNHLMLFRDTMLASIDLRYIDDTLPENPSGMLAVAGKDIARRYHETAGQKYTTSNKAGGVQALFLDYYQRKAWGSRFDALDYLKQQLIKNGVKEDDIGLIRESGSNRSKREQMFARARRGDIRIIIGNTTTMGEGVNIQARLTDVDHLSVPYRPADLIQREGRGARTGNENPQFRIHRWATKGAMASAWDMIDRKARSLSGLISNVPITEQTADDIGNELGADEITALILGSASVKLRAEVRREVQNLIQEREDLEATWAGAKNAVASLPFRIKDIEQVAEKMKSVMASYSKDTPHKYGGKTFEKLSELQLAIGARETYEAEIFGVPIKVAPHTSSLYKLQMGGFNTGKHYLPSDSSLSLDSLATAHGFLKAGGIPAYLKKDLEKIEAMKGQIVTAQETIQKGRGWTEEKALKLTDAVDREDAITAQITVESALEEEERALRIQQAGTEGGVPKVGRYFSVGAGLQPEFAGDAGVREDAERVVRQIFPGVKGVYFSDALYGSGPELAASQSAAGQPIRESGEVAGKMERARAIVELSLSKKFNLIGTAYHEAYHLARMLLTPAERGVLTSVYGTEEEEAYAFQDWNLAADRPPGAIAAIWKQLKSLFQALGNLLRGRGYDSVDKIFDRVRIGAVGARAAQEAMEGEAYASREEKYLDSTNRTLNSVTEQHEALVQEATGGKRSSTRIRIDFIREQMKEKLFSEEELRKILDRQSTLTEGKLTVEAQVWRELNQYARHTAAKAAESLKDSNAKGNAPTDDQLMEFSQSLTVLREVWERANAMTAEIGRALRAFREPLEPLALDTIDSLDKSIDRVLTKQPLGPEVIAGVEFTKEEMLELFKEVSVSNKEFGLDAGIGEDASLLDLLRHLKQGEIEGLTAQWRANPKALVELIDAVLLEELRHAAANPTTMGKSTAWDKIIWLFYYSALSSPMTLMRNGVSGALMLGIGVPIEEAMQAAMPIPGSMTWGEWKAGMGGAQTFNADMREAAEAFWETLTTGRLDDPLAFEQREKVEAGYVWGKNHWLARSMFKPKPGERRGLAEFMPGRIMLATDNAVKKIAHKRSLRQQAFRLLNKPKVKKKYAGREAEFTQAFVNHPPVIAKMTARSYGRFMTFQEPMVGLGKAVSKLRKEVPLLFFLFPFVQVPYNILRHQFRRMPGIPMLVPRFRNGKWSMYGWRRMAGKLGPREQAIAIAEQAAGLMLFLTGYFLVSSGMGTGGGPDEPDERRVWRTVFRPYSIMLGDDWWEYLNFGGDLYSGAAAVSMSFWESIGWGSVEGLDPEASGIDQGIEFMHRMMSGVSHSALERSMLRGPKEAIDFLSRPETRERYLRRQLTMPVTNLVKFLSQTSQETVPEVNSLFDEIKSSLPWVSKTLMPRRTIFGDPIERWKYQTPEFQRDPIENRKQRWATELTRLGIGRRKPPRSILGGVQLTPEEYDLWATMKGESYFKAVNAVMSHPAYWRMGDQRKKYALHLAFRVPAFDLPEKAFMGLMLKSNNPRIRDRWLEIEKNLGRSSDPGDVF